MSRAKLFLENFFTYGFISILNKIIPFLLLPLITRLLTDPSDFGVYDMFNQIIGFGSPLIMLGMYDAMFREYFEKEDASYRYNVTTTANRIVLISSIVGFAILLIFNKAFSNIFFGSREYGNIVLFSAISLLISTNCVIIAAPTRIQNQRKVYVVSGLLSSAGGYFISILLLWLGYSYFGLIYSNILMGGILLVFFFMLNKKFFSLGKFDMNITKELFKIGLPLLPTFLIYWVYNSMDRIMIANILGTRELGIYSIGSKIASISMLIYAAFAGGWQYFAFSTMKDDDQVELNSKVFEYLGAISFLSVLAIYPIIKILFGIMFAGEYLKGHIVVPYLYLSPLLLMLFQIAGNQFLVIKKSYLSTITLSLGALANIILNTILIPRMGIEGAAIATLMGYMITIIMVCLITSKMKLMNVSKRLIIISILTTVYLIVCRIYLFDYVEYQLAYSLMMLILFGLIFKNELSIVIYRIKIKIKDKSKKV